MRQESDALVRSKGKKLVVIHHAVHRLDPVSVEVTVQDDPLRVGGGDAGEVPHHAGEEPILPLPRC